MRVSYDKITFNDLKNFVESARSETNRLNEPTIDSLILYKFIDEQRILIQKQDIIIEKIRSELNLINQKLKDIGAN